MTDTKAVEPKKVYSNDTTQKIFERINPFVEELLADEDAKTPLIGLYLYSGQNVPYPIMYTDFNKTYSSYGPNTNLGEARTFNLRELSTEVYIWKNAKIPGDTESKKLGFKPRTWRCVKAQVDTMNGTGHASDGESEYFFSSLKGVTPQQLVNEINDIMLEENTGLWVNELWEMPVDAKAFIYPPGASIPKLSNDHVSGTLTGYAVDGYDAAVMFNVVSYKATNDSLVATARAGKSLNAQNSIYKFPSKEVKVINEPVPSISLTHTCIIAREACPGMYKPGDVKIYILTFDRENPLEDLRGKFFKAIDQMLVHPIEEEWTDAILDAATGSGFMKELNCGGDVIKGYAIYPGRDWDTLMDNLRASGRIKIIE